MVYAGHAAGALVWAAECVCSWLWQDALLAHGAVQELVACMVRSADRPVPEYAASALLVLSHNHPGACFLGLSILVCFSSMVCLLGTATILQGADSG